jgi:hypothetical protein
MSQDGRQPRQSSTKPGSRRSVGHFAFVKSYLLLNPSQQIHAYHVSVLPTAPPTKKQRHRILHGPEPPSFHRVEVGRHLGLPIRRTTLQVVLNIHFPAPGLDRTQHSASSPRPFPRLTKCYPLFPSAQVLTSRLV